MTIHPITPTVPVCAGVCCEHANCQRYRLMDGASGDVLRIMTCDDGRGGRPLFVAVETKEPA